MNSTVVRKAVPTSTTRKQQVPIYCDNGDTVEVGGYNEVVQRLWKIYEGTEVREEWRDEN